MGKQVAPDTNLNNDIGGSNPISSASASNPQSNKIDEVRISSAVAPVNNSQNKYIPRMIDVWALGINTVLGGQFYGWNEGMVAGFGSYAIGQTLVGLAYVNLALSLSEICSTISFSGGAYGMTRVVLGFYVGFLVAAFELMEYITYISAAALFIARFMCDELGWESDYIPLICLVFYLCMIALVLEGNHVFWRVNKLMAIGIVSIIIIYILGSLQFTNLDRYARLNIDDDANANVQETAGDRQYWFAGGMVAFLRAVPLMTWGFGGIEATALVTDIIENPRVNVSYGISAAVLTLFVCMICVMFVGSSLPSDGLQLFAAMNYYMDSGFVLMGISTSAAHWLVLPAQFAMGGGFFVPAAKLYHAISESHLLPPFLQVHHFHPKQKIQDADASIISTTLQSIHESVTNQHHQYAVIYVSMVSYALCLISFYVPSFTMDSIPILFAQFTYFTDLYAYYQLKQVLNTSSSEGDSELFLNPLGIIGAGYSCLIFALVAISVILYSDNNYIEIIFVSCYTIVMSIYYFTYAKHHQIFSEEEQKKLLSLHVITNNRRKKKSSKRRVSKRSLFAYFLTTSNNRSSSKRQGSSFSVHSQPQQQSKSQNNSLNHNHNNQHQVGHQGSEHGGPLSANELV